MPEVTAYEHGVPAKSTELGGMVLAPPFDVPPGRMAVFADPRDAAFAVIAMAAR